MQARCPPHRGNSNLMYWLSGKQGEVQVGREGMGGQFGRMGKQTKTRREEFLELKAAGQSTQTAAGLVGVTASTGYAWARQDRDQRSNDDRSAAATVPGFARLVRQSDVPGRIEIEIDGILLRVEERINVAALSGLVAAIRKAQ